ncbi:methyltransferase domain-containing protein [Niveispirillum sp. SYP-B3756]|uniref:class I SAM-dependent methyltransferase n=1 Tax=Niveispirillum sp. SYP-B3756 TaxID=2662178 RepID=UPI0012926B97|nr:class I SAM-dependent methyltransferase [Niveispirillum sp. SYP-B3756]MQP64535.1 methyltransferase domain-containing protein [Niveispirillum sp. SYP-B3756]
MTTDWSAGYMAEVSYTHGFYRELTPSLLEFAALLSGHRAPQTLAYCELGCGQGYSSNLLAAANPHIQFHATDFNPTQVVGARDLAAAADSTNITFYEDSFGEFVARTDLPDFDIIALHGIYSWISDKHRGEIVEFIRRRLRPGGLVYISYNTLPGWAAAMPLRRLLVEGAAGAAGKSVFARIEEALRLAETVSGVNGRYFAHNPGVADRLNRIKGQSRAYLAHEFFNEHWTPFYHGDVAAELAAAKLSWITSAFLLDRLDAINLSPEQQQVLNQIDDVSRRETLRDFMVNQQFRRDIFVKGAVRLLTGESHSLWARQRFTLSVERTKVSMKVKGAMGEAVLQEEVYVPLLDALERGCPSFTELLTDPALVAMNPQRVQQALMVLVGVGYVQPVLSDVGAEERHQRCRAFNEAVMRRARWSSELQYLASPVFGGAVMQDQVSQLFLLALTEGEADPSAFVWRALSRNNQRMFRDGKPLTDDADNLTELRGKYRVFQVDTLPLLRRLGIA